jgi:RNA polymerase sigma-70 factor (ECF subfamily)
LIRWRTRPNDPRRSPERPPGDVARTELVEKLFREHNEALIRFLLGRVRSYHEAREVAQEAYVRLLSLDQPGAVSYLRSFLFRTAANIAIDRQRREEVHGRATDLPAFHEFVDSRTPERQVLGEEKMARLQRIVAAMPPKCREAFVLNQFYGKDFAVVAAELSISQSMVRKYVTRALTACRAQLDLDDELDGRTPE